MTVGFLTALLAEATVSYLSAQIDAGAEAVMLFDSWAGILSPPQFRRHVIEPTQAIVKALKQRHPMVPVIGFPRLAGLLVGEYAASTRVDGIGLDTSMELGLAARVVPARTAIQGNLDPGLLLGTPEEVTRRTRALVAATEGKAHIVNLGHGILPSSRIDCVEAFFAAAREPLAIPTAVERGA